MRGVHVASKCVYLPSTFRNGIIWFYVEWFKIYSRYITYWFLCIVYITSNISIIYIQVHLNWNSRQTTGLEFEDVSFVIVGHFIENNNKISFQFFHKYRIIYMNIKRKTCKRFPNLVDSIYLYKKKSMKYKKRKRR